MNQQKDPVREKKERRNFQLGIHVGGKDFMPCDAVPCQSIALLAI